jgi:regulator of nucleoside diphosphate kinase
MLTNYRIVSILDRQRLLKALDRAQRSWLTYAPYLDFFRRELRGSEAVPTERVPHDIVTLGSRFNMTDQQTGRESIHTLVLPDEEHVGGEAVSVLSPMGVAVYGTRAGQVVSWITHAGIRSARVVAVLDQPERLRAA